MLIFILRNIKYIEKSITKVFGKIIKSIRDREREDREKKRERESMIKYSIVTKYEHLWILA